jgi:hypothetical protein
MRYFPMALYAYIAGAAGLGFSVGAGITEPTIQTLIVSLVAGTFALAGHFMMRPYMREAKAAINAVAIKRYEEVKKPVEEKNDVGL